MFIFLIACTLAGCVSAGEVLVPASVSCRTDLTQPDTNRSDSSKLSIRSDTSAAKSWIKFDLSALADRSSIRGAVLRLALHENEGDYHFDVSAVNDDYTTNISWGEMDITWNNAPANDTASQYDPDFSKATLMGTIDLTGNYLAGSQHFIDVSPAILGDNDGIVQFILHNSNSLINCATHDHSGGAEYWPTLIVTYPPPGADYPDPAIGETVATDFGYLSWQPGLGAVRSEIYLGKDTAAVANAQRLGGDVNGDGLVDLSDLVELVAQWLMAPSSPCPDLDYSGIVDLPDFAKIASDWQESADAVYLGSTTGSTFDLGALDPGTTYYWRVDSVSCDGIEPGEVWNFQTAMPVLPAFPGAEGFGAQSNGGRGGDVYTVVNLNSSGPGSLRYGVENAPASGRTIVFAVSGYIPINYNSDTGNQTVRIVQDNVTIAGQTAPGDGIGLKDGRILVTGNNVVLRHLRIRHGKYGGAGDCLNLESSADNSIIDHVSLMFSTDENISFFNSALDYFTMQYSTSSWGMERHNAGGLWDLVNGSCHHSLWAHHRTRNPKARPYGLLEWINNVTYHWRSEGFIMGDSESNVDWYANVMGCYYLSIPDYEFGLNNIALSKARIASDGQPNFHLHLNNCLHDADGDGLLNGTDKGYDIVDGQPYDPLEGAPAGTVRYDLSATPFTGALISVTIDEPLTAYKKVLSSAGALRLDATYAGPLRDELDTLLIESVENQESILVAKDTPVTSDPNEPPSNGEQHLADAYGISNNGFGTLNTAVAPTDTDGDGMPDFWECSIGSTYTLQNHNDLVPAGAYITNVPSGYTLLEEYLHFCAIPHAVISKRTVSEPSSLTVDLRRYTRGFNVAPVVFSLSSIQNGSATIQPDGYTVVFEPTLDFSGRARFDFTVTDGDGSTWAQTLAVLVSSPPPPSSPTGLWAQATNAQVYLDWQDNGEADLAGYNVYRTTTSGSAYTQINTSLVTTSEYTDTDVVNSTIYHYIVRAVNIYMNESAGTSEVSARPVASGTSAIIQENTVGFCGLDGTVDNNNAGFTGDGFCNSDNNIDMGIDWKVNIATAGTYTITWRYANGGGSDRPGALLANDSTLVSNISFPATDDWTTWDEVSQTVDLSAGSQVLRLQATGTSGLGNIDYIEIVGVNVTPTDCL
ncbi:MAG: carbohydrate-binding protein [Sedimentisphaerales bacterium]|nr:carbohydrate-binding protein [Sedimentisphaerales bacterium]